MRGLSMKRMPVSLVLIGLALAACSTARRTPPTQAPVEPREIPAAAGDVQKTLDGFKEALGNNPGAKKSTSDYIRAVEEIKSAADLASEQRDYARARGLYRVLLKNHSDFEAFAPKLTFNKGDLETALKECRIALVDTPARADPQGRELRPGPRNLSGRPQGRSGRYGSRGRLSGDSRRHQSGGRQSLRREGFRPGRARQRPPRPAFRLFRDSEKGPRIFQGGT